ncbi:MAG: response regulator [Cyanobacteria bacterium J06648_16]
MVDKEVEIKLQFLDEAEDYLNTLESTLLGVSERGLALEAANAALRAAHSIKGGAALMGYGRVSELAHRLEESFKVLKSRQSEQSVDADLERLLLAAVDAVRQVIGCDRTQLPPDPDWLKAQVTPLFDQLYDQLGEADPEDASAMLSSDDSQDIIPVLFETEVEGCLVRLETALQTGNPQLREEVDILSQELGGLGEMLQMGDFYQLCRSVEVAIRQATAEQVSEVAQLALDHWRQAQRSVLEPSVESMPNRLTGLSFEIPEVEVAESFDSLADLPLDSDDEIPEETSLVDLADETFEDLAVVEEISPSSDAIEVVTADAVVPNETFSHTATEADADAAGSTGTGVADVPASYSAEVTPTVRLENADFDAVAAVFEQFDEPEPSPQPPSEQSSSTRPSSPKSPSTKQTGQTEFRFSQTPTVELPEDDQDATVRVSVKQLNALNDYFGELTTERHQLDAETKRLRDLAALLQQRLQIMRDINGELRDAYDKTSTDVSGVFDQGATPLLPAATETVSSVWADSAVTSRGFDSLEFDQYNAHHISFRDMMESVVQLQEVADDIELSVDTTEQTARNLHRTSRQLQRNLNQLRMRPLADVIDRFPRALRELSLEYGKPVELVVEGDSTLVDRNVLEALNDPLMHLVRNAFDHGIEPPNARVAQGKPEQGTITIRAQHRSNRTLITLSDDGNGIDLERIRDRARAMGLDEILLSNASEADLLSLIFEPGFSTADQVTTLSGRGVGMDVVRNNLKQIRGDISVSTQAGEGTTFTISVPYTLSVTRVLLAESNRMPLAFPTDNIEGVTVLSPEARYEQDGLEMFRWNNQPARLVNLSRWLAFNCPRQIDGLENTPNITVPSVLIFNYNGQLYGLQIDRSWGEQEVAVRRIQGNIALPAGFSNCTILGDGQVVPLVNVPDLVRWILSCEGSNIRSAASLYANPLLTGDLSQLQPVLPGQEQATVLVIDDSVNVRRLLALTLEKQGYRVAQAKDGLDALEKLDSGLTVQAVVCDIEMPRLDGYGFLAKLRASQSYGQLPVTMLTSRTSEKHRKLAMKLGADAYFSKPYREQALLKTLENAVRPAMVR